MFDYIIVGGGSAGGVLANRLSENVNNKVCLIEAGSADSSIFVSTPGAFGAHMYMRKFNWAFNSQPDAGTSSRGQFCPRGKGLGGSSSINAMVYTRGHSSDYDHWAALGNPGWGFKDVLPIFKKSEDNENGANEYHGEGGLLSVSSVDRNYYKLEDMFITAAQEAGVPFRNEFNDNELEGIGNYQFTIKNGQRAGVRKCFIEPALQRKNLTVITEAHASKILIKNKKAVGVQYQQQGELKEAFASQEVIVSGGTFNSPQLLMLSGIGDKDELEKFGIECVHDLKGVGKNLQEHPTVSVVCSSLKKDGFSLSPGALATRTKELIQFALGKKGPLRHSITRVGGYLKSSNDVEVPDVQVHYVPILFDDHGRNLDLFFQHGFTAELNVCRPKSIGQVTLRNANPASDPLIQLNLLDDPYDIDVLVKAVRKVREIFNMPAYSQHKGEELFPGKDCQTNEEIAQAIRDKASHVYHPVGTCKMGNDDMAVVDASLKVYGIESLRVVDASIMPSLISANTNAPTIMIGEKAAEMILADSNNI
ncbi:GMC family oxidoreductase [Aliiglaciecola aliphaticivorans]|jgi:choline dehydrogenase-like flavoprotein|tara:strand:- start:860 stop:2464 length:1605 start_codon:yes stop_codon:yes gene_type:complete